MLNRYVFNNDDLKYLRLLSKQFPSIQKASTEIINLQAILELPKGTEHFISDLHGEADAFLHIVNNCSGNIRNKMQTLFQDRLTEDEISELATLVYYPEVKLDLIKENVQDLNGWYRFALSILIEVCQASASKFTRSKVRKSMPKDFEYILDELLHADHSIQNKEEYYSKIIQSIIDIDRADAFIVAICGVIKRLIIDRLHVLGDIFDRGERPDIIINYLMKHHSVDLQWGNHDILWMGAASGSGACICNVLTNAMKYNILTVIEDIYSINLLPLALFAEDLYKEKVSKIYYPKVKVNYEMHDVDLMAKMRKVLSIIMFKLEGQAIMRHPNYRMNDRLLLDKIDFEKKTVQVDGISYPMLDCDFPTVDPNNPYLLTPQEELLMDKLIHSFRFSEKLQEHIKFLYDAGSLYKVFNGNILYHACLPLNEKGEFMEFTFKGKTFKGKAFFDYCEQWVRRGYYAKDGTKEKQDGEDFMWWLWCGKNAPTTGRVKITTFERLFIADESTHKEPKNHYYSFYDNQQFCEKVFHEFGIYNTKNSHIINGHMPVATIKGETPVKANGKLLLIDGGFCSAYHKTTGIAGYTMFYNSWGIRLAAHEPFFGTEQAIATNRDIVSTTVVFETATKRIKVGDTDIGKELKIQIEDLKKLLYAYKSGLIKEYK